MEGTPLHLRIAFGSFWIELPLRRPQQQPSTPPPTPRTAAQLEDIPVTWEGTLLQQLLAEPEIQAQLQTAAQTLDLDTVRRWSRAKHGDAAEVERLLRAHIAWRADFVPGGSIPEVCRLHNCQCLASSVLPCIPHHPPPASNCMLSTPYQSSCMGPHAVSAHKAWCL